MIQHNSISEELKFDLEASWAGLCPWTLTRCFGDYDGRVLIEAASADSKVNFDSIPQSLASAINGIAFTESAMAVSSPTNLWIGQRQLGSGMQFGAQKMFNFGSHDIISTSSGKFYAPINIDGFLVIELSTQGSIKDKSISIIESGVPYNFYKLTAIASDEQGDLLVGSTLDKGIVILKVSSSNELISCYNYSVPGVSIIDVVSLNGSCLPYGVVCLSRNHGLIFIEDVTREPTPKQLKIPDMPVGAYSLAYVQGHLFVLTDKNLVFIPQIAKQFSDPSQVDGGIDMSFEPCEATDIFAVGESELAICEKQVSLIEIDDLTSNLLRLKMTSPITIEADKNRWSETKGSPSTVSEESSGSNYHRVRSHDVLI